MDVESLRHQIDQLIEADAPEQASRYLADLWRRERNTCAGSFVISRYERLRNRLPLRPYRLSVLRSFTLEPVVPLVRAAAFTMGIDLTVQLGQFNAYAQEILDVDSDLYRFRPDAVILAVQTCDIAPDLWRDYSDLTPEQSGEAVSRVISGVRGWVDVLRKHSQANLIIHGFEQPAVPRMGVLGRQVKNSQTWCIQQLSDELARLATEFPGVYVLDYDALVARHGRAHWRDEGKWLTARLPIASGHLIHLAEEWVRFLVPLTGRIAKALVVDLDGTLWGGILGEDGLDGIQVGEEHPGAPYRALQRVLLDLHRRGVLLAICSKNAQEDALQAIDKHPGMLLRSHHFAAMRINWNDKAQSLREIASELNIGTEALAFLDDNPAERALVEAQLPEVVTIALPADPLGYAGALQASPVFERLSLSVEDQDRTKYYAAQRKRAQHQQSCQSKEDFYWFLQQEAEIAYLSRESLSRVAQLTQKTNQLNLTTRRYTEQRIQHLACAPGWQVFSMRVQDRYGNNGIVGVAIAHLVDDVCEIDTFLLSCRVIGRTLETAFLSHLVEWAREHGAAQIQGWFLPTRKNTPAKDFYSLHGFRRLDEREGGTLWVLDLLRAEIRCPKWIRLTIPENVAK